MLRRLFSSANMVGGSGSPSSPACSAPSNSADKVPRSSRTRDDLSGFLQLVSRLDDFEGSLKVTVNMLSRHCQAIVGCVVVAQVCA
uniref:Uncharacterized protein n=1 Tax=Globisporangium ultimum (strain ATCC 200006 / CBS 805.95 / DAOM BR144) TaxID=431595 RepID=K3WL31_GLOUD